MTELATEQNLANNCVASPEESEIEAGDPLPIGGTHQLGEGVNFVLFSRNATRVRLELYQHPDDSYPTRIIDLDPMSHRTGDIWHIWVRGIPVGQLYGYRIEGLINRRQAVASTRTSCFWIHMQEQLPASRIGIFQPLAATTPPAD
jgi:pullulanase/glycogen debranching enzyme